MAERSKDEMVDWIVNQQIGLDPKQRAAYRRDLEEKSDQTIRDEYNSLLSITHRSNANRHPGIIW